MRRMKKVWQTILVAAVVGGIGVAVLPSTAVAEGKCDGKTKLTHVGARRAPVRPYAETFPQGPQWRRTYWVL